jgi:carbon storage regulator
MRRALGVESKARAKGVVEVLVLGRRAGEAVMIGHDIKVTVIVIAEDEVRIGIDAPQEVEVHREEVYLEIQQANLQAASASAEGSRS